MSFLAYIGESVKDNTQKRLPNYEQGSSVWFPHGPLGFGGHYSPGQIREFLREMSLDELGAKGLKLRVIVGGIAMTIIGSGAVFLR